MLTSDLRVIVDWGRKWLVDFDSRKTQLDWFDRSICTRALFTNSGTIDVKMYGSALKKIVF